MHIDTSSGWEFIKGRAPRGWLSFKSGPHGRKVSLPHCWNEQDAFRDGVSYYRGKGSYRTLFRLPEGSCLPGYRWFLRSEGFYGTGEVRLNGGQISRINGRYLGFALDLTDRISENGDNALGIELTNKCSRHILPGISDPDFILYGGLAGRISLLRLPPVSLSRGNIEIAFKKTGTGTYELKVKAGVVNTSDRDASPAIGFKILDQSDRETGQSEMRRIEATAHTTAEGTLTATVTGVREWSLKEPCVYKLVCFLEESARIADVVETSVGFRTAEFVRGKGFLLNGEHVELRGCNRHESVPGFGNALPLSLHVEDARLIKSAGLNFVRLSHYPQHPAFLDACDRLGILVYAEIATWKSVRGGRWLANAKRQMREMILRDGHHPSIIAWGMGNEARSRKAYLQLKELVRSLDPGRPVTYAENHLHRALRKKTFDIPDFWAANYELDRIEEGAGLTESQTALLSECANRPHTVRGNTRAEVEQAEAISDVLESIKHKPCVAGFAIWSFNDYATMRKRRYNRHCGIFDAWRSPKMAAAFLTALYSEKPFLKLFADWTSFHITGDGSPGRRIFVLTNCEEVILKANGKQTGTLHGSTLQRATCSFEPGVLEAEGVKAGVTVRDSLRSFTEAVCIELEPESESVRPGESVGIVIRVLDDERHLVMDWNGDIRTVCEPAGFLKTLDKAGSVEIRGGTGRTFLSPGYDKGTIQIAAFCEGLKSGSATVSVT